ncbi:MAG: TatD family hydrolase [Anaerococcus sp.]|nr:TatD family hydrolase [Anaerococcus sp.]
MLVNTHDHLNFYENLEEGLETIKEEEIVSLINTMNYSEYKKLKETYVDNPLLKIGLGIHPWEIGEKTSLEDMEEALETCDFIGEVGLDFYWAKDKDLYERQVEVFDQVLAKALAYDKVLNIHTKGAEDLVLKLLEEHKPRSPIIHWYSGNLDLISRYLNLGCFFTIGPDFKISKKTDDLIKILPIERILTETDGPTSIKWARGFYKDSSFIKDILSYIGEIKEIPYRKTKQLVYDNYLKLKI